MTVGSYSEATELANGSCVKSALVHVGGHSWRVVFYPNGRLAGTTGFMSLYLLMDEDEEGGGQPPPPQPGTTSTWCSF